MKLKIKFLAICIGFIGLNLLFFYLQFASKTLAEIHMFPMRLIHLITSTHVTSFSLLTGLIINSLLFTFLVLKTRTFIIRNRKISNQ